MLLSLLTASGVITQFRSSLRTENMKIYIQFYDMLLLIFFFFQSHWFIMSFCEKPKNFSLFRICICMQRCVVRVSEKSNNSWLNSTKRSRDFTENFSFANFAPRSMSRSVDAFVYYRFLRCTFNTWRFAADFQLTANSNMNELFDDIHDGFYISFFRFRFISITLVVRLMRRCNNVRGIITSLYTSERLHIDEEVGIYKNTGNV